jgi:hypothetical protein
MKSALAALAAVVFAGTGCMVRLPVAHTHAASSAAAPAGKQCPPGHMWSDGRCHDKGKGHDKQSRRDR